MEPEGGEEEGLSAAERKIKERFGEKGLRVYSLVDGKRTAEQIMNEAGVSEDELVEILDFMDEEGIIKLDYPAQTRKPSFAPPPSYAPSEQRSAFAPILEEREAPQEIITISSPIELPKKEQMDMVRSLQIQGKLLLKYKDKGKRVFDAIDGKRDIVDIALTLNIPLYEVKEILDFLLSEGAIVLEPLNREEVRKKYGYDGYAVYKKYGKEGVMLYELIGKDLSLRDMAELVSKEKENIIDMFIFIHKVLGIELPLDKEMLRKQLGL